MNQYSSNADRIVDFDKYQGISAKDFERMKCADDGAIDYEFSVTSSIPKRDTILKSKNNKQRLPSECCNGN